MLIRNTSLLSIVCAAGLIGCQGNSVVQNKPADSSVAENQQKSELAMKFSLAQLRESDDQLVKAKATYEELLAEAPQNAEYNHRYGVLLCKLGDYEKGIEALRTADSIQPNDVDILNDLGFACMVTDRNDLAISVLETALESDPRNGRATNNLAMAHGYQGDFDEAFSLFSQVMSEAEAMANLGYIATQSGRKDFAVECYSRALDLDPDMNQAKEALVQLADLENRIEQRKAIAAASTQNDGGVVHASATVEKDAKQKIRQATHKWGQSQKR